MFTLEEVNKEIPKYNKYTSYNISNIHSIEYTNLNENMQAKVDYDDLIQNKYIIHISNDLNACPIEYQKAVLWHEFTHIYDYECYKTKEENIIKGILKSYSEAHAESILLRYLLHITPRQIIHSERRNIIYSGGKSELNIVSRNYINISIELLKKFNNNQSFEKFSSAINNFCYFCGYLLLKKKSDAIKLSDYAISLYPEQYISDLKLLYQAISNNEVGVSALIYNKLKSQYITGLFTQ